MKTNPTYYPVFAAIGFTCIFGLSFMFSRSALSYIQPLHLLGFRFLLAAIFMNVLRILRFIKVDITGSLKPLLLLSILQPLLYFSTETIGIQLTSASEAGLMVSIIPIFTILFARVFLNERPTGYQIGAIVLSITGVLLIGIMQASGGFGSNVWGLLILLGAPLSGAGFSVMSRYCSRRFSVVSMTYIMMHVGLAVFFPASILQHLYNKNLASFLSPLSHVEVWFGVLYLGILSSVAAFFLMNYALSLLPASQVSVFPSLTTLIAVSTSVVFLKEELYWYHIIGGLLIIVGVWGANYFSSRQTQQKQSVQGLETY